MYEVDETNYGVVLLSGKESCFYRVTVGGGTTIQLLKRVTIKLQKKQKKGGQSAQRIGRIRQEKRNMYIKQLVDITMVQYFLNTVCKVSGFIIAGPGCLKDDYLKHDVIKQYVSNNVIKTMSIGVIHSNSVREVLNACEDFLCITDEMKKGYEKISLIKDLMNDIRGDGDKLAIGYDEIVSGLEGFMLETILVPSNISNKAFKHLVRLNTYGCIVIKMPEHCLEFCGGIVGIKYY